MNRLFPFIVALLFLCSCADEYDELNAIPILMSRNEMEAAVKLETPRPIRKAGPTCLFKHALYVQERYEGVHVFDNSNPTAPVKKGFLRIPGSYHIAVLKGILVADNAVDLITFDLSNPLQPILKERVRSILSQTPAPYGTIFKHIPSADELVVGYRDSIIQYRND
jgi:hypothetical protein